MEIPSNLIAGFISAFSSLFILIVGWGYNVIRKNTLVMNGVLQVIAEIQQKNKDDDKVSENDHAVINKRLDEHSCVLKSHEKEIIRLNTIAEIDGLKTKKNCTKI